MIGNINEARFGSAILPLAAYSYNSVLKALRANDARIRASPMLFLASRVCALPAATGVVLLPASQAVSTCREMVTLRR